MLSVVVYDIPAISIHAPASGATASDVAVLTGGTDFNPRSREWSDDRLLYRLEQLGISIHAPASGATAFIDIFSFTVRLYFISSH